MPTFSIEKEFTHNEIDYRFTGTVDFDDDGYAEDFNGIFETYSEDQDNEIEVDDPVECAGTLADLMGLDFNELSADLDSDNGDIIYDQNKNR